MPAKKKIAITVRLEPRLARRIKKLAKKADRSASSMIAWILEDRVAIEESHIDAILKGMQDIREGRFVDADEFFDHFERELKEKREGKGLRKRPA